MNDVAIFAKKELTSEEQKFINLHEKTYHNGLYASLYLYEFSKNLQEMNTSELYKLAGFKTFEDYAEKMLNLKKSQAYNYIKIAETYSREFMELSGVEVGMTKLLILSDFGEEKAYAYLEEHDVKNQSVKELKDEISKLKLYKENSKKTLDDKEEEIATLEICNDTIQKELECKEKEISKIKLELSNLQKEKATIEVKEIIKEVPVENKKKIEELQNLVSTLTEEKEKLERKIIKEKESKIKVETLTEELSKLKEEKAGLSLENAELTKKIKLSSNVDFNSFKSQFSLLQKIVEETLKMILAFKDPEFKSKCYLALNKYLEGVINCG